MKKIIHKFTATAVIALLTVLIVSQYASAQDQTTATSVTDDQVNAIAQKLYCPVCENITLDTCGTAACADWREEIRLQLEAGRNEEQIVADFVQRFGDRVVGTPQDATLRALSLVTPWILIGGVLLIVGSMVLNHQRKRAKVAASTTPADEQTAQKYHDLLERDLKG